MVKTALLVLVALTATARAQEYEEDDPNPAFNMLGFRFAIGQLPLDHDRTLAYSVGVGVEHPVFKKTRVFGEYEWLWLTHIDQRMATPGIIRPEEHGTGHRLTAGLRRELFAKNLSHAVRFFCDGELGGGVALVDDNMTGVEVIPAGTGGIRFGYDMYSGSDESPSRTFEVEFLLRAVAVKGGVGGMFGLGMFWGN
jgi:hypothetical protein